VTKSQDWARERCWHNKGSLAGIIVRISQIASSDSTLDTEYNKLLTANDYLQRVLDQWNSRKDESKSQYLSRRTCK
jgi:hypothetical protein